MPHEKKIIIINGPINSGKGVLSSYLNRHINKSRSCEIVNIADPLKKAAHVLVGSKGDPHLYDLEEYKELKDKRHPLMFGHSPREMYILLNEFGKKNLGESFLVKTFCNIVNNLNITTVIVECGVLSEAQIIVSAFGKNNVIALEIQRLGYDFGEDYRVSLNKKLSCESYIILNPNGGKDVMFSLAKAVVDDFLGT